MRTTESTILDKEKGKMNELNQRRRKEPVCPVEFYEPQTEGTCEERKVSGKNETNGCTNDYPPKAALQTQIEENCRRAYAVENFENPYISSIHQSDIVSRYQGKMMYEVGKAEIALKKQAASNEQKLMLENALQEMRLRYKTCLDLVEMNVYKDSNGQLIFAVQDHKKAKIAAKKLLNVQGVQSRLYVASYPVLKTVFEMSWDEGKSICLPYTEEGISPTDFLKKIKSRGVFLSVSGRTEKRAAEALFAYLLYTSEEVEIPYFHGWVVTSAGEWHYAEEYEITMKELINIG